MDLINKALATNEDKQMLKGELELIWNRANEWYKGGDTLEIGAYLGMCSHLFAAIIENGGNKGKHYISDTFNSEKGDNSWGYKEHTEKMLLDNLGEYSKYVQTIVGETLSDECSAEIKKRKYDFVWHDGDHTYPNFLNDLLMIDKLTDNIMLHDYGHVQVTQSVDEFCEIKGYEVKVWVPGKYGLAEIIK